MTARTAWLSRVLCLLVLLLAPPIAQAQALQPVPALTTRVIDQTGTLDAASLASLEAKLAAFEQSRGSQVVVVMVATTAPEDIADYTQRLGDAWKIGRRDVGDGVLFVIAKDDRRLRIATAKTLEGAIPDLLARRILDQAVTPAFRRGDYAGGIEAGVDQILARISGEELPLPGDGRDARAGGTGFEWMDLVIFMVFAVPFISLALRSIFGNKLGTLLTGLGAGGLAWALTYVLWIAIGAGLVGLLAALFMQFMPASSSGGGRGGRGGGHWGPPGGGWGGGGRSGGFGGGGGFSSGGGGNFGGGGASGGW
ncbi:MAG: YgcG family protein [Hydrogenophaga sp.]|uniref:TPM domain-containing protein n=1 Tax=Hydrogenophaga sp. TaxID=1904254 RepID=UPI003D0F054D